MILSKDRLVENIFTEISDNSTGEISPHDIRHNLIDIIDSIHLLSVSENISSNNLDTFGEGNTRLGIDTLRKAYISGYSSIHNTAIGSFALKSNAQGERNTALGSNALTCNINGSDNIGLGYHALAGTTIGISNIGVGNYSLNFNRKGNFNIALGHGAGYYIPEEDNYKFFLASHPVDDAYICANPSGVGLIPLLEGDLSQSNLRLGIAVSGLHDGATLQVGGDIHPSESEVFDIGSLNYKLKNIYITSGIYFDDKRTGATTIPSMVYVSDQTNSNQKFSLSRNLEILGSGDFTDNLRTTKDILSSGTIYSNSGIFTSGSIFTNQSIYFNNNLIPLRHRIINIGNSGAQLLNIDTHNINVTGRATFKKLHAIEQTHFHHKSIHLASSGDVHTLDGGGAAGIYTQYNPSNEEQIKQIYAYLNDEELNNAGLILNSTGIDYNRTYEFSFRSRDDSLQYLTTDTNFSRNSWFSNISLHVNSGSHLHANRVIYKSHFALTNNIDGRGIFDRNNKFYFTNENNINNNHVGLGNFNFFPHSGDKILNTVFGLLGSGNISLKFLNRINSNTLDIDNNPKYNGFDFAYITDSSLEKPSFFNEQFGQEARRFVLRSFNNTSFAKRSFMLLQDNSDGVVGINNFEFGDSLLPDTALNVRSTGDAIIRSTAENNSLSRASLQLLYGDNYLQNGIDITYFHPSGTFQINKYQNGTKNNILNLYNNNRLGIFLDDVHNAESCLSLGAKNNNAFFAIEESSGVPSGVEGFGTIFIKKLGNANKSSELNFVDSSGNIFSFIVDAVDELGKSIEKSLLVDSLGNTFGGRNSPIDRANLNNFTLANTAIGNSALSAITNGSNNIVYGYQAAKSIRNGTNNIIFGANTLSSSPSGNNNIIIGNQILSSDNSLINNKFIIGNFNNYLFDGDISTKSIKMPSGNLVFTNSSDVLGLSINHDSIEKINYLNNNPYVGESLSFKFKNSQTNTLMVLDHSKPPVNKVPVYSSTQSPFVEVRGDIKLLGGISFSDNTYLDSASFLQNISSVTAGLGSANTNISSLQSSVASINNQLSLLVVEGYALNDIPAPTNAASVRTGKLQLQVVINGQLVNKVAQNLSDVTTVDIHNRDTRMPIDKGDYIIAIRVGNEYRPIWISGPRT
jgi:hypothetical protein